MVVRFIIWDLPHNNLLLHYGSPSSVDIASLYDTFLKSQLVLNCESPSTTGLHSSRTISPPKRRKQPIKKVVSTALLACFRPQFLILLTVTFV